MAITMVACGSGQNPDAILHEYTPPEFSPEAMPREIVVDQDMYDAWEYVIDKAMGDGAVFSSVPAFSMSKGYFRQETEKMGYEHRELTASSLTARAEGYNIDIYNYLNHDEKAPIEEISVQIFGMDQADFNQEILDNVNSTITLGQSQQLLGKTTDEMFEYLEITDLMLEFIKQFGSSSKSNYGSSSDIQYSYAWFAGNTAWYHIIYTEGYDSFYKADTASISFIREENGYEQQVSYSNVSGGPVCSVHCKERRLNEKYMQSFEKNASRWHTKESMVDLWIITEKIENGISTAFATGSDADLLLDWKSCGQMEVPVFSDNLVDIDWSRCNDAIQENPEEKLVFEVEVDNKQLPSVLMEYYYADDSIIMKNEENTLAYKFERVN